MDGCCLLVKFTAAHQNRNTWGGEFDFEVSVPPTLGFAYFESILFKKAYYDIISSGLKLIKMAYLPPKYGQNMDFSLLAEYNGYI